VDRSTTTGIAPPPGQPSSEDSSCQQECKAGVKQSVHSCSRGQIPRGYPSNLDDRHVRLKCGIENQPAPWRIRHPGGLMGELYIRALGASPMTVTGAEVPVALQQGVVDGLVTTPVHYHDARWHTRYMTLPFYAGYGVPLVASLRWWNSLPEDIQDIIENKVMPETMEFAYNSVIDLENRYIEEMQQPPYGVQITWLSPDEMDRFAAQVRDQAIERFVKAVCERGLDPPREERIVDGGRFGWPAQWDLHDRDLPVRCRVAVRPLATERVGGDVDQHARVELPGLVPVLDVRHECVGV
jgi:hypothetical protein